MSSSPRRVHNCPSMRVHGMGRIHCAHAQLQTHRTHNTEPTTPRRRCRSGNTWRQSASTCALSLCPSRGRIRPCLACTTLPSPPICSPRPPVCDARVTGKGDISLGYVGWRWICSLACGSVRTRIAQVHEDSLACAAKRAADRYCELPQLMWAHLLIPSSVP